MKWLDYKAFKRDFDKEDDIKNDSDIVGGCMDFILGGRYASRWMLKHWWWSLIPLLNVYILFLLLFIGFSFPIRLVILIIQLLGTSKIYDIEDTTTEYKIVRDKSGLMGVCHWDIPYTLGRYIAVRMKYKDIYRYNNYFFVTSVDGYVGLLTDSTKWIAPIKDKCIDIHQYNDNIFLGRTADGKKGLYLSDEENHKCIVPCIYDDIYITSDKIVEATLNGRKSFFTLKGDRYIK